MPATGAKKEAPRADLIIYGATGFTGKKIAIELAKNPFKARKLTWAISGRSKSKLDLLFQEILKILSPGISQPKVIVVDIIEQELLQKTMASFKICINCVGPFRLYGAPVVKACVLAKTHYVDICGETEFIERAFADWNDTAIENEVSMIPACGYDSVPADIGALFAKLQFQKQDAICTQSEMFVQFGSGPSGMAINSTTFIAAVLGFASVENLRALRRKTHRKLEYFGQPLKMINSPKWNPIASGYTVPLPASDVPVVKLGQQIVQTHIERYRDQKPFSNSKYKPSPLPPVYFAGYIAMKSWLAILYLSYIGILLSLTSRLVFLRNLVMKYPGFFTLGLFTEKGPTEKQLSEGFFSQTFVSRGYKMNQLDSGGSKVGPPTLEVITRCTGPEMGYVTTPASVLTCALLLLNENTKSKIPHGVLTPASAFSNVASELLDGLKKRGGVEFNLVSIKEL